MDTPNQELGHSFGGKVTNVVDGDTIDVDIAISVRVRLKDCWAPERNEEGGNASTRNLRAQCLGETCVLRIPVEPGAGLASIFSFGRIVGFVKVGGMDLSQLQIDAGYATAKKARKR